MNRLNALAKEGKINENASIKDSHSVIINAPIAKVWEILIDIEKWPEWNNIVKEASIKDPVEIETPFSWYFNGVRFNSQIQAISEPNMLTWTGKSKLIKSAFVWQLENDDDQTIATFSASLQGTFTVLVNKHQRVYNELMTWLENLKKSAES